MIAQRTLILIDITPTEEEIYAIQDSLRDKHWDAQFQPAEVSKGTHNRKQVTQFACLPLPTAVGWFLTSSPP